MHAICAGLPIRQVHISVAYAAVRLAILCAHHITPGSPAAIHNIATATRIDPPMDDHRDSVSGWVVMAGPVLLSCRYL
jgi:hypothetical protein